MSANYDQLRNSNLASSTMPSDQFVQLVQRDGKHVYKHAGHYAVDDKKVITSITPSGGTPVDLNAKTVDFKLDNAVVDVMNYVSLHFTLVNNTGSNATIVGAPLFIDQLQVFGQNGNTELAVITGDDLYQQFFFLDRNTYEAQAPSIGLSATTYSSTGATVADTASISMSCPLYHFFKSINIAPAFLKQPMLLRFRFKPTSLTHITGATLTINSLTMVIRGKKLKEDTRNAVREFYSPYSRIPLSLSHLTVDRMVDTRNLVASQVQTIKMSNKGICSYLIFTIRLATDVLTPTGQINYVRPDSFDILDSSGGSLIGHLARDVVVQRIDYANNLGNNAWEQKGFCMMSFASNPREAFSTGANSGYCILTGNESLRFTTGSGLASGSYQIEIKAYCYANVVYEKDVLKLEKD